MAPNRPRGRRLSRRQEGSDHLRECMAFSDIENHRALPRPDVRSSRFAPHGTGSRPPARTSAPSEMNRAVSSPAGRPHCQTRRRRPHEHPDRRGALPQPAHRRVASQEGLHQTRNHVPQRPPIRPPGPCQNPPRSSKSSTPTQADPPSDTSVPPVEASAGPVPNASLAIDLVSRPCHAP